MRQTITTTVVTPATGAMTAEGTTVANPYDLTTLEVVKNELGIPDSDTSQDVWIGRAITRGSAAFSNYCNRVFPPETVQDQIWLQSDAYPYQVPGVVAPLRLTRWPVISVTSVSVNQGNGYTQTLTAGTDYYLDAKNGELIRLNVWTTFPTNWDGAPTAVTYQAGYATIPSDLEQAILLWIAGAYQGRKRDPMLKENEQPGLGRQVYWIPSAKETQFEPEITELLAKYRVPTVQ